MSAPLQHRTARVLSTARRRCSNHGAATRSGESRRSDAARPCCHDSRREAAEAPVPGGSLGMEGLECGQLDASPSHRRRQFGRAVDPSRSPCHSGAELVSWTGARGTKRASARGCARRAPIDHDAVAELAGRCAAVPRWLPGPECAALAEHPDRHRPVFWPRKCEFSHARSKLRTSRISAVHADARRPDPPRGRRRTARRFPPGRGALGLTAQGRTTEQRWSWNAPTDAVQIGRRSAEARLTCRPGLRRQRQGRRRASGRTWLSAPSTSSVDVVGLRPEERHQVTRWGCQLAGFDASG